MPNIRNKTEEKDWKHAVNIVKDEKDKSKSKFKDLDWGLTMHIFKNIQKSKKKKKKAELLAGLVKIANSLDRSGEYFLAEQIDNLLAQI